MRRIERLNVRVAGCVAAIASSVVVTGAGAQPQSCGSDLNRDGVINGADLGVLLGQWGANGGRARVPAWAEVVEPLPDPAVVTDAALRQAIISTGFAWRVRDRATHVEMLLVPPGSFSMGCSGSVLTGRGAEITCSEHTYGGNDRGLPAHGVTITKPFYLARYELTQAQWQAQMGNNPSNYQSVPQVDATTFGFPVDSLIWRDVQRYLTATGMRLPTEAEWEFACRAGVAAPFHDGTNFEGDASSGLNSIAWFQSAVAGSLPAETPHTVGGKKANHLGFHDMLANIAEPVADWFAPYSNASQVDPVGPASGTRHVWRGGTWADDSDTDTCSFRLEYSGGTDPSFDGAGGFTGLRVARSPGDAASAAYAGSPADLSGDGRIDGADLGIMLGEWGVCARTPAWAERVAAYPDPNTVTDPSLRARIVATGLDWCVRDSRTGIVMMLVPPGNFTMGCSVAPIGGFCGADEYPVHQVTLSSALYVGQDEVTQKQWTDQMSGNNPSTFQDGVDAPERPVESVPLTGSGSIEQFLVATGMRLPTEAEWEYACRAGTSAPLYHGSSDLSLLGGLAWFSENAGGTTHPAGQRLVNGFGLRDMLGNVAEWVGDRVQNYASEAQLNPTGPQSEFLGNQRVLRGGSFSDGAARVTSSARGSLGASPLTTADPSVGFRVVRTP